ncbi:hypothetical protein [Couchioplanes caeruleus]|uniref:Uncharacterized protein n=2 Tax=Couchioplanes caeruleus TaxID=56438 RepID=A0A1K0FC58_9ACTN|nr:hypothetical protein [Couchioplanes caeruleus]OJF10413.1 hypothetical protein BG844_32300 [Couchioplanes caeruleus subsp. caeruleus]ROP29806.1 hypothetical protein EDD30_2623 [Couchioplanes caeruleus]
MKKRSIALAIPALLLTAACGGLADMLNDGPTAPWEVDAATFVDVWAGYQSSAHYDLRSDGTFTATGVPAGQLGDLYERTGRVGPFHGHGHWKLDDPSNDSPPTSRKAALDFDELLDADNSHVPRPGTIQFYAMVPKDSGFSPAVILETDEGDHFQRLR